MLTEKELETVADQIYWSMERGQITQAVRLLQERQKEGLQAAAELVDKSQTDTPVSDIKAMMAQLPC